MQVLDHSDRKEVYIVNGAFMVRQGIIIEKHHNRVSRYPLYGNNWQAYSSNCFGILAGRVGETLPVDHHAIKHALFVNSENGKLHIWETLADAEDAGLIITDINPTTGKRFSNEIPLHIINHDGEYIISCLEKSAYWIPDVVFSEDHPEAGIEEVSRHISDYGLMFHNHSLRVSLQTSTDIDLAVDSATVKQIEKAINEKTLFKIQMFDEEFENE